MGKKKDYRQLILDYVKQEYATEPEHLWKEYPNYEVLRHKDNDKWYGILMDVRRETLGLSGDGFVDILVVKLEPFMVDLLKNQKGYRPGYHMNKKYWLTLLLDGSLKEEKILDHLDQSYTLTASKNNKKAAKRRGPRNWLIPSNPKYYDVVAAFKEYEIIDWKQSSDIHVGDLVYMYVGAPYSAILYKCKAVEVNIPYREEHMLNIKRLMKIQLLNTFEPDFMPLERMKGEFGVWAVRGPRGIPETLKEELDRYVR